MVVVPAAVSEGFKTTFGASEPRTRTATARLELVFKSRSGSIFVSLEVKFYERVSIPRCGLRGLGAWSFLAAVALPRRHACWTGMSSACMLASGGHLGRSASHYAIGQDERTLHKAIKLLRGFRYLFGPACAVHDQGPSLPRTEAPGPEGHKIAPCQAALSRLSLSPAKTALPPSH